MSKEKQKTPEAVKDSAKNAEIFKAVKEKTTEVTGLEKEVKEMVEKKAKIKFMMDKVQWLINDVKNWKQTIEAKSKSSPFYFINLIWKIAAAIENTVDYDYMMDKYKYTWTWTKEDADYMNKLYNEWLKSWKVDELWLVHFDIKEAYIYDILGNVYFWHKKIEWADPKSFKIIERDIAKDKNNVYFCENRIPWSDSATFKKVKKWTCEDKNYTYTMDRDFSLVCTAKSKDIQDYTMRHSPY